MYTALDERTIEHEGEVGQVHEGEVLAYVKFKAIACGAFGIYIRVHLVGTTRNGVGPLYRTVKVLVEGGKAHLVALGGVPLITQVDIVDVARLEGGVALY